MAIDTRHRSARAHHVLGEHPPPQRRLGTEQEQGVGARQAGRPHPHDRPLDVPSRRSPTGRVAFEADARRTVAKSGEPLGVDVADLRRRQLVIMCSTAPDAESPASFHPVKA